MNKDTRISDILFPGVVLDCEVDGLTVSSVLRIDNEFILSLIVDEEPLNLVFGWDKDTPTATAVADACEETLLYWQEKGSSLHLVGAVGKPYLLYSSLIQGVCIPRSA